MIGRYAAHAVLVVAVAGCGSWKRVGSDEPRPEASETLTQLVNLPVYYQRLGRLAAGAPLPFVGTVAFAAGPGDSVNAVVGLSLENRALTFQREGSSFVARYRVELAFERAGAPAGTPPVQVGRDELVRVASFQETQRADESILFQQTFKLLPGNYKVTVSLRDPASSGSTAASAQVTAPAFAAASTTAPILVYQASARATAADPLQVVLNSRGAVAYGGDTLLAYIEGYRFPGPTTVPFEVRTEDDSVVYGDSLRFRGGEPVETQVVRLSPDSIALGALKLVVGTDSAKQISALVSFSQAWVVTNFDEMVQLLRYFGHTADVDALKDAPPAERARLWREFWRKTDPNPSTPENEALDEYFGRVALANQRFRDEGVPGWRTDRGEVFVTLGEPDEIYDASPTSQGRIIRWVYIGERLTLYFVDETGFGRFRQTPASRAEYERVLQRVRRREG